MKLGKFIVAAGPVFLLAVGPALAAGGDSGLWNFSDKTVYQIDPTSSLGQMMKKAGRKGEPDKINNFPACLSPKTAQIFAPNPKSINPKLPNSDCVIQIVNQTDSVMSFDIECKGSVIHNGINWINSRHIVETIKTSFEGMTSTMTRTKTWVRAANCDDLLHEK